MIPRGTGVPIIMVYSLGWGGWIIWRVFGDNPPIITMGTATAFATAFALPLGAIQLWKWYRERDK